jgi:LMP1
LNEYFKSNKFKHILHEYEELCKENSGRFLDSEELADIAEYYHLIGKEEEARVAATYATNVFPGATAPLCFLARTALFIDKDFVKAKQFAEDIIDKEDLDYYYLIAEILMVQNKNEETDKYLSECFRRVAEDEQQDYIFDVASLYCDYGLAELAQKWLSLYEDIETQEYKELKAKILLWIGKSNESEEVLNELIDSNPYSTIYWNELAECHFIRGEHNKSITASEYSLAINPEDEDALLNKANALYCIGNSSEAINYYKRFQKVAIGTRKNFANITIADIYLSQQKIEQAIQYFTKAIENSEAKEETYIQMAISLMGNGYIKDAYQMFSNNLKKMPTDWNIGYAYYARCCYELGLMEEYYKVLNVAIKKNLAETKELLADLYPKNCKPVNYNQFTPMQRKRKTDENTLPF